MAAIVRRTVRAAAPWQRLVVAGIGAAAVALAAPAAAQGTATWSPVSQIRNDETTAETWARRTEEAILHRTPGLAPEHSEGDGPRDEPQSVWNSLAATWLAIVLAGLLLLVAGAVQRWLHADRGDGPPSILK